MYKGKVARSPQIVRNVGAKTMIIQYFIEVSYNVVLRSPFSYSALPEMRQVYKTI